MPVIDGRARRVLGAGRRCSLTTSVLGEWARLGTPKQVEYLAGYLEAERDSRDASRRAQLLRRCGLPAPKTFDGYDWSAVSWPDGLGREDLLSLSFLERREDLVLMGGLATLGWTVSRGPTEGGSMADPKHPRHFTDDFKRQIASLYNAGKPPSEIMREYDLGSTTLRRWINSINATGSPHAADDRTPEQNRIIELERENKRLRMEVDVLKQAALTFARK